MNWRDAFEERINLWHFWHTQVGAAVASGFARDAREKKRTMGDTEFYDQMHRLEALKLAHADPIFIDEDMCHLIDNARQSFDPETLEWEDLLVPWGFALLAQPITTADVHGNQISHRAVSWGPVWDSTEVDPGTHVLHHGLVENMDDAEARIATAAETSERFGQPAFVNVTLYSAKGDPDGYAYDKLVEGTFLARYRLSPLMMNLVPLGEDPADMKTTAEAANTGATEEDIERSHAEGWAALQVMWRLMMQRISTRDICKVERPARRRAQRAGLTEHDAVRVITLRRLRQEGEADERHVEWSHRWIVDGHWRNQWYPSLNRHRRIWISPYVKGPEDAELRVKEKAYQLTR